METTALYVEYIVIGMETLSWIIMTVFIIIGNSFIKILKYCISNILPSIIAIILCYVLGLVTDRIADKLFEKEEKILKIILNFKHKQALQSGKTIQILLTQILLFPE